MVLEGIICGMIMMIFTMKNRAYYGIAIIFASQFCQLLINAEFGKKKLIAKIWNTVVPVRYFWMSELFNLGCGIVNEMAGNSISTWKKMVWCMIIITVFEFLTGIIVNVKLGWHIWDYSGMPLHVMGQICVPYMFLWYGISGIAIWINKMCDKVAQM